MSGLAGTCTLAVAYLVSHMFSLLLKLGNFSLSYFFMKESCLKQVSLAKLTCLDGVPCVLSSYLNNEDLPELHYGLVLICSTRSSTNSLDLAEGCSFSSISLSYYGMRASLLLGVLTLRIPVFISSLFATEVFVDGGIVRGGDARTERPSIYLSTSPSLMQTNALLLS